MHVSEVLKPNVAKGLTRKEADLPSDIFIQVVEHGDWHSRIAQEVQGGGDQGA
jgi:hypothetical protein